jgi:hypothetical protein
MVVSEQHPTVGAQDRRGVLEHAANLLEGRYVLSEVGRTLAQQLRHDATADRWQALTDPGEFAAALTEHLRASSGDGHLAVNYSAAAVRPVDITAAYSEQEAERYYGGRVNHGFEKFELLPDNIGYLSRGGAHPFEYRPLHPHFVLCLAASRSINPITNGNWQGVGVVPDIAVPAAQALDAALELIRSS